MAFLLIATILVIATLLLILVPLKRDAGKTRWTMIIVAVLFVGSAAGLYASLGYWQSVVPMATSDTESTSAKNMVEQLAARLVREPDNLQGWALLGRSYLVLGDYPKAERALAHALSLNNEAGNPPNPELLSSYAEVLVLMNQGQITTRAYAIFERVLALAPNNPRALLFTGLAAFGQQNYALAEKRLAHVMELNPPESLRAIIVPRLEQARAKLGQFNTKPANTEPAINSEVAANSLTVSIRLADKLQSQVSGQGVLFIYARSPQGGPPLAVERHAVSELPLTVALDSNDAMIPSRHIDIKKPMIIGARISRTGQALPQSGDLQGETQFTPGNASDIEIVIDSVVP